MSVGISVGYENYKAEYNNYYKFSTNEAIGMWDVEVGRAFSPKIALFFQGVLAAPDTSGYTLNIMFRPSTASSLYLYGGAGMYRPGETQGAITAGVGFDIWRISIDGRGFAGVGENSTSSGLLLTVNYFWERFNPFGS